MGDPEERLRAAGARAKEKYATFQPIPDDVIRRVSRRGALLAFGVVIASLATIGGLVIAVSDWGHDGRRSVRDVPESTRVASSPSEQSSERSFVGIVLDPSSGDGISKLDAVFPDGTPITLRYPDNVELHRFGLRPTGSLEITHNGQECSTIFLSSYVTDTPFHPDGSPDATFMTPSGTQVELWKARPPDVKHYLIFRADEWYVAISDTEDGCVSRNSWIDAWIANFDMTIGDLGLPVVQLGPDAHFGHLNLTASNANFYSDIRIEECSINARDSEMVEGAEVSRSDGFAHWCTPGTNVEFRAYGSEKFLDELVAGLRVE